MAPPTDLQQSDEFEESHVQIRASGVMARHCAAVRPLAGSDGHGAGHLLVVDDEVGVALVVVEDDIDLRIHPVVHTRVKQVAGGVAWVDGRRPAHGGVSYGEPERQAEEEGGG